VLLETRCGPIEYQEAGQGVPLLVVHGSGGGHDQGMAFARPLARRGIRVIAMSRFGYLRTPMPADASVPAQADAHVCLLDALGMARDDRYETYAGAAYTASRIAGARFIVFDTGGHTWLGHNDEVMARVRELLIPADMAQAP